MIRRTHAHVDVTAIIGIKDNERLKVLVDEDRKRII